jgi:hypothetical protein
MRRRLSAKVSTSRYRPDFSVPRPHFGHSNGVGVSSLSDLGSVTGFMSVSQSGHLTCPKSGPGDAWIAMAVCPFSDELSR